MAKRSLQASTDGIKNAKKAFSNRGLTQQGLSVQVGLKTRQPIWRFFTGQPVDRFIFMDICRVLGLDWRLVALNPPEDIFEIDQIDVLEGKRLVARIKRARQERIVEQCGLVNLLDTHRTVSMDEFYVDINVLEEISSRSYLSDESFKKSTLIEYDRLGLEDVYQKQLPGMLTIQKYGKVRVLGKAGSGKTTFLQSLAYQCSKGLYLPTLIPVFISCRDYVDWIKEDIEQQHGLLSYINQEFASSQINTDIEPLLAQGLFLLLFDGIDEVLRRNTDPLLNSIRRLLERYPDNILVISCRTSAAIDSLKGFFDVEIAPFTQKQISIFVHKWFSAIDSSAAKSENIAQKAEQMLDSLKEPENFKYRSLVTTPLFLHLACWIFEYRGLFPIKESEFYRQCLDILLIKWDQSRNLKRDVYYRLLRSSQKLKLLSEIAYITFINDNFLFKKEDIEHYISDYLTKLSHESDQSDEPEELQGQSERIFASLEFQHGIIIGRSQDLYSFAYLVFQEYLTARKIVADYNLKGNDQVLREMVEHICDLRWREVFLLSAGILKNADSLILLMKNKIDSLVEKDTHIQEFLAWTMRRSDEVVKLRPNFSATRGFYLALISKPDLASQVALSCALDQGVILDIALDHLCLECTINPTALNCTYLCAQSLSNTIKIIQDAKLKQSLQNLLDELPYSNKSRQQFQTWWSTSYFHWFAKLRTAISKYRNIEHKWNFSIDQERLLYSYYQANLLLIDCLNGGNVITKEIKDSVEQNLFLPQKELQEREWNH